VPEIAVPACSVTLTAVVGTVCLRASRAGAVACSLFRLGVQSKLVGQVYAKVWGAARTHLE
jgi:hypothetical protein